MCFTEHYFFFKYNKNSPFVNHLCHSITSALNALMYPRTPISFIHILYIVSPSWVHQSLLSITGFFPLFWCTSFISTSKLSPHSPPSVWISITLSIRLSHPFISLVGWMASSKDQSDRTTAFISDSEHISKRYMWEPFSPTAAVHPH